MCNDWVHSLLLSLCAGAAMLRSVSLIKIDASFDGAPQWIGTPRAMLHSADGTLHVSSLS